MVALSSPPKLIIILTIFVTFLILGRIQTTFTGYFVATQNGLSLALFMLKAHMQNAVSSQADHHHHLHHLPQLYEMYCVNLKVVCKDLFSLYFFYFNIVFL